MEKIINFDTVPHLTTAVSGPIHSLEQHLLDRQIDIESWLREQWLKTPAAMTSSVDIRNAGSKLAPVDTNLFPAGFNNLNPAFLPLAITAAQAVVSQYLPDCKKILIVPESHTRNPFYMQSLARLAEIFNKAGYQTKIGSLIATLKEPYTIPLENQRSIQLEPIKLCDNEIVCGDFKPCIIVLNNDLSETVPEILQQAKQPILPSAKLGWHQRLKSNHFRHYDQVIKEFSKLISLDPWLINPLFDTCQAVDFIKREGEDCLVSKTKQMLEKIQIKYDQYGIKDTPFAVIKADSGTYGMGVMMVRDAEEIRHLNRKQRTRMSATKGSQRLNRVIIQEGVYTFETWGEHESVAEPVVYMLGQYVIGGFYRVHKGRGQAENLNAPGMHFEPLAFAEVCNNPDTSLAPAEHVNRFYAYGVIARLAALAAAREIAEVEDSI